MYFTKSSFLGSSFRQPPSVGPRHLGIMLNWTALPGPFQKLDTRWQQRGVFLLGGYILEPLFFGNVFFTYLEIEKPSKKPRQWVGRLVLVAIYVWFVWFISVNTRRVADMKFHKSCRQFGTHFAVSRGELLEIIIIICLKSDHFWTGFHSCFTAVLMFSCASKCCCFASSTKSGCRVHCVQTGVDGQLVESHEKNQWGNDDLAGEWWAYPLRTVPYPLPFSALFESMIFRTSPVGIKLG